MLLENHLLGQVEQPDGEQVNLQAAPGFLLEQAQGQAGTPEGEQQAELALRLCVALCRFWFNRGYGREGLRFASVLVLFLCSPDTLL
jgi:hypothetical protein